MWPARFRAIGVGGIIFSLYSLGYILAGLAALFIVPRYGWEWTFIITVILAIAVFTLRFMLQESVRCVIEKTENKFAAARALAAAQEGAGRKPAKAARARAFRCRSGYVTLLLPPITVPAGVIWRIMVVRERQRGGQRGTRESRYTREEGSLHATEVLREDHARIEGLLEELAGQETRSGHFERLERELVVHMLAEDNVFLPQVEDAIEDSKKTTAEFFDRDADVLEEAAGLISESYENHREVRELLERAKQDRSDENGELRRAVEAQVETEEKLFPRAEKVLEEEDFERIGDLIEHCKRQVRGMAQASLASSSGFKPRPGSDPEQS